MDRIVNAYRKISINKIQLKINGAPIGSKVNLRIYPNERTGLSEIRFWHNDKFFGSQKVKNKGLNIVRF